MSDNYQPPSGTNPSQRRGFDVAAREQAQAAATAARAQAQAAATVARAQAQAATTVVISTVVSLVTSAFGFVAALAWNSAITTVLNHRVLPAVANLHLGPSSVALIYALLVTVLAIAVVFALTRVAARWVRQSTSPLTDPTKPGGSVF